MPPSLPCADREAWYSGCKCRAMVRSSRATTGPLLHIPTPGGSPLEVLCTVCVCIEGRRQGGIDRNKPCSCCSLVFRYSASTTQAARLFWTEGTGGTASCLHKWRCLNRAQSTHGPGGGLQETLPVSMDAPRDWFSLLIWVYPWIHKPSPSHSLQKEMLSGRYTALILLFPCVLF